MTFLLSTPRRSVAWPSIPDGRRIYAIGDIHGSAALLNLLIDRILADSSRRIRQSETIVVLGDFIDRGTESAAVIQSLFSHRLAANLIVLLGNHESAMVSAYRGNRQALAFWLKFGGVATLSSFGVDTAMLDPTNPEAALILLRRHVSRELIDWMAALPKFYRAGDYFFVHAGIRPGVALSRQKTSDLLWIRDEFLTSARHHGVLVVHGHSPHERIDFRNNRIGIDTGAHESGALSAIGLEKGERWVIDTR